ncbi:hypothetical protein, partial [Acidisoma sp. S159]|uniref:hypothetical protein n=1 Tax=Acidisoma sp. S159 TaxID=1747225 RepID=UPI001C206F0F
THLLLRHLHRSQCHLLSQRMSPDPRLLSVSMFDPTPARLGADVFLDVIALVEQRRRASAAQRVWQDRLLH